MSEKEIPVCECGITPPYWKRKRVEHGEATLNNDTLDWEETNHDGDDEFYCGECGDSASEDNDDKLQELYL